MSPRLDFRGLEAGFTQQWHQALHVMLRLAGHGLRTVN